MSSTCLMSSYSKSKKLPNGSKNAGVYAESSLLDEFRTADGEIIEPYRTLKVGRGANKREIKTAYKKLAKKYHPDGARNLSILPGKCNSVDEIRDEWERVKLAYEILSDKKRRARYERKSSLADPGAAMTRAAFKTIGWSITNVGKGIFKMSQIALSKATDKDNAISEDINDMKN